MFASVLVVALAVGVWVLFLRPDSDVVAGTPVQIEIPSGASTTEIAERLSLAGVVINANMFRLQARLSQSDGDLKAGIYDLVAGLSYDQAIDELTRGPKVKYVTVTIPEGFVVEQIAERLEAEAGIPASEFLALAKGGAGEFVSGHSYLESAYAGSLEGYLFPKTYRIKEGSTARDVIEMTLRQFDKEIASIDIGPAEKRGLTMNELVTIASMIEREAQLAKERPLVSSVIFNRLEKGMRLEIDATIEYVLPGNRFRLENRHLKIDSPYNTYMYKGIPPGPIANPGIESLRAAVDPADTDYMYYVLTGKDGSHTFATNFDEFLKAKQRSKEVFGE
ncbi:MAG: endolytic transglycosylase MltG [Actinomycetota bacterium]|nr:endolytic transglycosylase MltG [Actinomycetota bacterium]